MAGAAVSGFFLDGSAVWCALRTRMSRPRLYHPRGWRRQPFGRCCRICAICAGRLWVEIGAHHGDGNLDALVFRGLLLGHGRILETRHLTLGRPFRLGHGCASDRQACCNLTSASSLDSSQAARHGNALRSSARLQALFSFSGRGYHYGQHSLTGAPVLC